MASIPAPPESAEEESEGEFAKGPAKYFISTQEYCIVIFVCASFPPYKVVPRSSWIIIHGHCFDSSIPYFDK
jgi:hypothetical protein